MLNAGNGHYDERVFDTAYWTTAKSAAESLFYKGTRGHLVTITSGQENEWLWSSSGFASAPDNRYWLGAYQDHSAPDYSEPAGGWRWVTGEQWTYTNWAPGEPNNLYGNQDYIHWGDSQYWDDSGASDWSIYIKGYIVEYDAVPEPSAFVALITGIMGIGAMKMRKSSYRR